MSPYHRMPSGPLTRSSCEQSVRAASAASWLHGAEPGSAPSRATSDQSPACVAFAFARAAPLTHPTNFALSSVGSSRQSVPPYGRSTSNSFAASTAVENPAASASSDTIRLAM